MIVGRFAGKAGLAAIDSVYTLFKFPLNFMSGLSAGATIVISRHFGAGDEKKLTGSIRAAVVIAAVLGLVFSLLGAVLAAPLVGVFHTGVAGAAAATVCFICLFLYLIPGPLGGLFITAADSWRLPGIS